MIITLWKRAGGIFWKGGVDSERLAYICLKGSILWEGGGWIPGVSHSRIYIYMYILGGRGRIWECRI